jgi:glycine/D-amino acid oxidase-like deaminating enzyme
LEHDAGFLRVEACTAAHHRWAVARGAVVRARVRVAALDIDSGSVTATLDDGSIVTARKAVIAAGAWLASAPALREVARGLPLAVERQVQLWFEPQAATAGALRPPSLPAFIHFVESGAFYGIPPDDTHAAPAVKVCRHHGGAPTTADALDRTLRAEDEDVVRSYVRAHLPGADGPLLRARVCMYTNTPDEHFVVGPLARWPHVVVLGGFSGHGYKMASVIGDIAADLVLGGKSSFDLGMFAVDRFG